MFVPSDTLVEQSAVKYLRQAHWHCLLFSVQMANLRFSFRQNNQDRRALINGKPSQLIGNKYKCQHCNCTIFILGSLRFSSSPLSAFYHFMLSHFGEFPLFHQSQSLFLQFSCGFASGYPACVFAEPLTDSFLLGLPAKELLEQAPDCNLITLYLP